MGEGLRCSIWVLLAGINTGSDNTMARRHGDVSDEDEDTGALWQRAEISHLEASAFKDAISQGPIIDEIRVVRRQHLHEENAPLALLHNLVQRRLVKMSLRWKKLAFCEDLESRIRRRRRRWFLGPFRDKRNINGIG